MDKKKKIMTARHLLTMAILLLAFPLCAQEVSEILFFGHEETEDSITLKMAFSNNEKKRFLPSNEELKKLIINEDGNSIPHDCISIDRVTTGKRIPDDCTFSVLVDLTIPDEGKEEIKMAIKNLVERAPDSCVYLSFFGENVTSSKLVTNDNFEEFNFKETTPLKYFYGAVYAKLAEFSYFDYKASSFDKVKKESNYQKNKAICNRAGLVPDKNYLIIFCSNQEENYEAFIDYRTVTNYQREDDTTLIRPKVYAFYYGKDDDLKEGVNLTLIGLTINDKIPEQYRGSYKKSDDLNEVLVDFEKVVNDASYDYKVTYKRTPEKSYNGDVFYEAYWGEGNKKGQAKYSIGYKEQVTPKKESSNKWKSYLWALLITVLAIAFFFFVMKILIPGVKSKAFAAKYYKKYIPEENVQRRTCYFCRQEIHPGDKVVTRCRHIMHVSCWKQNDYQCAEYGQNCKEGIQEHVEWSNLFSSNTLRDLYLTTMGIIAGLVSWIFYTLIGNNLFKGLARGIANTLIDEDRSADIFEVCVGKISSFLLIGLLLGFFISLVMRHNDGVRRNDFKSIMKTLGLSLMTAVIGMSAFALGSIIFCWIVSSPSVSPNDWFCSLPAYLLFSICISLSLCIKSSIPLKSALLGGLCSAVIGFIVLYFSNFTNSNEGLDMLPNFIIYGGGLGASLVTVRMLAEKYYLVIKNGIKAGQRIPIHKWMNATGGGNKVTIGMIESCEIQMTWEKSNKVAKEHVQLYVDHQRSQAMLRPLVTGVNFNSRTELPMGKPVPLSNNDTFTVGDTIFQYVEN